MPFSHSRAAVDKISTGIVRRVDPLVIVEPLVINHG